MQNQPSNNLQQHKSSPLQPNRSDLQTPRSSDSYFGESGFSQDSLPMGSGRLRVESTSPSSGVKAYSNSYQSETSLMPFVVVASVILLLIVVLAAMAVRASSRNPKLATQPALRQAEPDLPETPRKKPKKTSRKKRRSQAQ